MEGFQTKQGMLNPKITKRITITVYSCSIKGQPPLPHFQQCTPAVSEVNLLYPISSSVLLQYQRSTSSTPFPAVYSCSIKGQPPLPHFQQLLCTAQQSQDLENCYTGTGFSPKSAQNTTSREYLHSLWLFGIVLTTSREI